MTIRTEDELNAAYKRLDEFQALIPQRTFTADETAEFDALLADIDSYKQRSPRRVSQGGAPSASASLSTASMRRELARNRIELADHADLTPPNPTDSVALSAASMRREIRRTGFDRWNRGG